MYEAHNSPNLDGRKVWLLLSRGHLKETSLRFWFHLHVLMRGEGRFKYREMCLNDKFTTKTCTCETHIIQDNEFYKYEQIFTLVSNRE